MRTRAIIGAGAAAVIAATGAAVIPLVSSAQAATPAAKVHTYSFISIDKKDLQYTKSTGSQGDWDVNAKGKVIGFDTVSFVADAKAQKVTLFVAVSVPGGELFGSGTQSFSDAVGKGTIIGGTGVYKHAKGTFTSKNANASGSKTAVTIKFTD